MTAPLAQAVRQLRSRWGWTLDQLAARSGVSRRLIVQIEHADANPSIGTLLRLADALEVTLSDLLGAPPSASLGVARARDATTLWRGPAGGRAQLLVSHGSLELWSWSLARHEHHQSTAHRSGSIELVTVTRGTLQIEVGAQRATITAPDGGWFDATHAHGYRNPTRSTTTFILVVLDPAAERGHSARRHRVMTLVSAAEERHE